MQKAGKPWLGNSLLVFAGLALAGVLAYDWQTPDAPRPITQLQVVQAEDATDPLDPVVLAATFTPILVQNGAQNIAATIPYTGYGQPGIYLSVSADAPVEGWAFVGWANRTTAQDGICRTESLHFSTYDWFFISRGDSTNAGAYYTVPTTVVPRLLPGGDQCLFQAGPSWRLEWCVEGDGDFDPRPREEPDGRHIDTLDRCDNATFKV